MKVTVNEKAVETSTMDAPSGAALDVLLDNLKKRGAIPPDEVVVSLEVNDRKWTSEDMDRLTETPVQDVAKLSVGTAGVREYGRRVLEDAASMLKVLHEGTRAIAVEFRQHTPEQANSHLFLLLDAIQSFFGCLFRVMNTCSPEHVARQSQFVERVTFSLEAIQACQETQDWNGLADQLESDLLPALDECATMISRLRKEI